MAVRAAPGHIGLTQEIIDHLGGATGDLRYLWSGCAIPRESQFPSTVLSFRHTGQHHEVGHPSLQQSEVFVALFDSRNAL
jgi:hypothetical protein